MILMVKKMISLKLLGTQKQLKMLLIKNELKTAGYPLNKGRPQEEDANGIEDDVICQDDDAIVLDNDHDILLCDDEESQELYDGSDYESEEFEPDLGSEESSSEDAADDEVPVVLLSGLMDEDHHSCHLNASGNIADDSIIWNVFLRFRDDLLMSQVAASRRPFQAVLGKAPEFHGSFGQGRDTPQTISKLVSFFEREGGGALNFREQFHFSARSASAMAIKHGRRLQEIPLVSVLSCAALLHHSS